MSPRFTFALAIFMAAQPLQAQEAEDEGRSLIEDGMRLFFEGLKDEMSPAIEDLRAITEDWGPDMMAFLRRMGPAFADLAGEVDDWTRYEAPELLPNGDIIMRKMPDPEEESPEAEEPLPPAGPTDI